MTGPIRVPASRLLREAWEEKICCDLLAEQLPERALPEASFATCYFGLTGAGRLAHEKWNPGPAGGPTRGHVT